MSKHLSYHVWKWREWSSNLTETGNWVVVTRGWAAGRLVNSPGAPIRQEKYALLHSRVTLVNKTALHISKYQREDFEYISLPWLDPHTTHTYLGLTWCCEYILLCARRKVERKDGRKEGRNVTEFMKNTNEIVFVAALWKCGIIA